MTDAADHTPDESHQGETLGGERPDPSTTASK
ncbi:DUF3072 domain-containing protein, partial [Curtobacterium sp. HSID17257]